jgi:pyruvate-formate lyase-activating enzyme
MFRCKYCHNPDTIPFENEAAMHLNENDILDRLAKEAEYF